MQLLTEMPKVCEIVFQLFLLIIQPVSMIDRH